MKETSSSANISTKLQRIAKMAEGMPHAVLTTLSHNIDHSWLREAYRRTRKDGAKGIDGQSAREYAANLDENLKSLLDRAKSGRYRAPAVKRVHIPKGDGKQMRPLGIPTFEDKVLQRAVAMILEAVYEGSFYDFSFGFRPKRSAHDAVRTAMDHVMRMRGGWVLEVDVRKFFDNLDHSHLQVILRQRVGDGVLLRLIGKWLNAGVLEEGGELSYPRAGTPQGGVISPILANIYLHEVLDDWFVQTVRPRLRGRAEVVRYADDFVMIFKREADARRVLEVLPKRFEQYGLSVHPEKTRLLNFARPNQRRENGPNGPGNRSFEMLGFCFYWGRAQAGYHVVKVKTASSRLSRALRRTAEWCRANRHRPVVEQHRVLCLKVRGHYAYYGVTFNSVALRALHFEVERIWKKWLTRRSRAARTANGWQWMSQMLQRLPLPAPRIIRSLIT